MAAALLLGEGSQAFGLPGLSALALVCAGILTVRLSGKKGSAGRFIMRSRRFPRPNTAGLRL